MEWGTFLTVVITLYLAYYGINFIYDMFVGGKSQVVSNAGVQYTVSDLMGDEEQARVISEKDFDDATVVVHHTPAPDSPADAPVPDPAVEVHHIPAADVPTEDDTIEIHPVPASPVPADVPAPDSAASIPEPSSDWAQADESEESEMIEMQVQGQPQTVGDFLKSFKIEAQSEAQSIFS